jgi:hypothetical protein
VAAVVVVVAEHGNNRHRRRRERVGEHPRLLDLSAGGEISREEQEIEAFELPDCRVQACFEPRPRVQVGARGDTRP